MKSTRFLLFAIVFAGLLAVLFQGHSALARQRAQLQESQQRTARLNRELADLNQTHGATLRELALAENQAAELFRPLPSVTNRDSPEDNSEQARWIARVNRLKQVIAAHPEHIIPEMRLLTDDDWLLVTRQNKLDSAERVRAALADIRTAAKERCAVRLVEAIRQFNAAAPADETVNSAPGRGGATTSRRAPTSALALAPYLENPADADVLRRLEVVNLGSRWALRETAPIDGEYDAGYRLYSNGGSGVPRAPWAWFPPDFDERSMRADSAYRAAHQGLPSPGWAETLPYFDPPLDPAIAAKIFQAQRRGAR